MKRKHVSIAGVLAVLLASVLVLAGCDNGATDNGGGGKLTITGLESIDSKYIFAGSTWLGTSSEGYALAAKGDGQNNTGVLVSGGKAELRVYKLIYNSEKQDNEASDYSGSDSDIKFTVYWKTTNDFSGWRTGHISGMTKFGEVTVSFVNGTAQGQAQAEK